MEKLDCRACLEEELIAIFLEKNIKRFRANQVFKWVQQKGAHDWEEMKNIGREDRDKLREILDLQPLEIIKEQHSKDGTRKFLFRLRDQESIETVLMDYNKTISRDRQTICLSTQVGCPVGCSFCATGMAGFQRNLTVGEITGQVLEVMKYLQKEDPEFKVTNIVFMGMGEPFLNYQAVLKAIKILNSVNGQQIGMRRMTISTSGVVPKIIQLAKDNPQVGLAISLHSTKDEIRNNLVPMNKKYPLAELMRACRNYLAITNRRITFEMALNNQNTSREEAEELVKLLKGITAHVNLIPVNPVKGSRVKRPRNKEISMFKEVLEAGRIPVSIREEKGVDIEAACGQLRQRLECEVYEAINQN
jgi:23S rRNA (adenine2503-C2)-methyltransferase